MGLMRQPIKIAAAAKMLGTTPGAIRNRLDGTESLTLFRRKGSNRLLTWNTEVEKLLNEIEIVASAAKK